MMTTQRFRRKRNIILSEGSFGTELNAIARSSKMKNDLEILNPENISNTLNEIK